jgi:nucleoside-diphosphate-sugar epimerase
MGWLLKHILMKKEQKRIFIAGASRPIGISLLRRLKKEDVYVTCLVNDWKERIKLCRLSDNTVCAPLFDTEKWQDHVKEYDVLIYCTHDFTGKENTYATLDLADELFYKLTIIQQVMKVQTFMYVTNMVKPDDRFSFLESEGEINAAKKKQLPV